MGQPTASATDATNVFSEQRYSVGRGAGLIDGERAAIVTLNMYPVQHRPSDVIVTASQGSVTISYTTPVEPMQMGDDYDLLVLAPAEYGEALQPLLDYKNEHGTPATLTILDDIPAAGDDQQESIKLYIRDAIETWGVTSVLLVGGGVDDGVQFPVRYAWIPSGSYEDKFPSDLYYADIYDANGSLSTWDANDNGKHAEYPDDMGAVDVYPDVYLGRLPATSVGQVTAVVDKIIDYEEHNKMLDSIIQLGGDTFPGDREGINEGEYANEQVLEQLPGYDATQLWASTGTLKKGKIITNFYRGADFVDFSGHGSPISWRPTLRATTASGSRKGRCTLHTRASSTWMSTGCSTSKSCPSSCSMPAPAASSPRPRTPWPGRSSKNSMAGRSPATAPQASATAAAAAAKPTACSAGWRSTCSRDSTRTRCSVSSGAAP